MTGLAADEPDEFDAFYANRNKPKPAASDLTAVPQPTIGAAPAPVSADAFDEFYQSKVTGNATIAAATARDANPDKFALADQIGRAMDLPAAVVERNLPELEAKHRQDELVKVLKDNPKLARWYSQHDNARAVSPEDAANLGTLEQLGNAWERGVLGLRQQGSGLALGADARALQNITAVEGRLARGEAPEDIPDIEDTYGVRYMTPDERGALRAQVQRSTGQRVLDVAGREVERNKINIDPTVQAALSAKTWGEFWTHFTEKPLTFIATVGTESLPQMGPTIVAGVVGGLAGGPAGAAAAAGAASYGLDYAASVLDAFRDEGVDLNNPLALRQSVNDPDLMARVGAKAAAHATAVGTFDALSGGIGSKTLAPAKITNRLAREATSMAAQLPVQGALGAAGEIAGTVAAGDEIKPGDVAAEFFGEFIGAPAEVASITGSSALHEVATNRAAAAAAQRNVDFFTALDTSAAGLAMREKLPERTRAAVNQILSSGPVDTVYVPAAKVQELFQSLGLSNQYDDPLSWFDSIAPGLGQEYTQAAALGADVAIPLGAYYTSIAGTDAHKILAEHLRLHPGEMTHYEATEWEKEADAAFERAMEEAQSSAGAEQTAAGPADAVFEDVVKRQVDAGMAPDQARQQGALYRAFFRIAGEKFKLDPFALYQRYGFEVRREIPQGLAETPVDQMDLLIDELRSSKQPRQKDLVGHSLLEFISRRGGVLEDAGELATMDAGKWHQGKRGRRKLVRDPALPKQPGEDFSLDETARAAWEAGYFPELGDQRPDVNALLEAIRGELSGKARYAERNVNAAGVERQQMLKDLEAALYTLGIDPATAPNEVVKEALRRAGAGVGADDALFQRARDAGYQGEDRGEAAEWISAVERGLPMDLESRMARARAMGFTIQAYHSTLSGDVGQAFRPGSHFGTLEAATDRQEQLLDWSAPRDDFVHPGEGQETPAIYPVLLRVDKPFVTDDLGEFQAPDIAMAMFDANIMNESGLDAAESGELDPTEMLLDLGYDAIRYTNAFEGKGSVSYMMLDPSGVRSVFAAFDPDSSSRTGLLFQPAPAVGSDAFEAWFGDSKVVDADGRPLVVYHGTGGDIEAFDPARFGQTDFGFLGKGFYLSNDPERASAYAESAGGQANVLPVYVSLTNPYRAGLGEKVPPREELEARGHDGIIVDLGPDEFAKIERRAPKPNEMEIVVFEPTQIKSVFNQGAFDPNDPRVLNQPAYHGSPHVFDKFSTDAIGTGEGAQVYGWGLYFASRKEVAQHYREALSRNELTYDGEPVPYPNFSKEMDDVWATAVHAVNDRGLDGAIDVYRQMVEEARDEPGSYAARYRRYFEELVRVLESGEIDPAKIGKTKRGRLYTVEIPDEGYLLWDKPLSEQPDAIRDRLAFLRQVHQVPPKNNIGAETTGGQMYQYLAERLGSQEEASRELLGEGVGGIKYLDQGSRGVGEGSYNFVVFSDDAVEVREFEQKRQDAKRGSIQLSPGHTVINLFAKADLSTFLHESGHFFLEVTRDLALRGDAPAEVLADWETLKRELGIPDDGPIPVEAHEKFATGFEDHLMEGKSPSAELAAAFRRFKAWLTYVYKTIERLGGRVSEPVRQVMDRMLASADEIAQAEASYRLAPAFVTAEAGGMTEAEFRSYMATAQRATDSATRELEKRLMLEVRREQEAQWKARRAEIRGEVEAEMAARPVYRALAFLRGKDLDGTVPVASMRLDREEVVALIGEAGLKRLPRSVPPVYAKSGGVDPGLVGDMFGFGSGAEMLEALMAVTPLAQAVEAETDARMHAEFGDLLADRAGLAEAADAAVHSDERALFLATELRALARKSGRNGRAVPAQAARDIARAVIGRTKIGEIRISVYAKAEQRAAREAEKAILAGDMAAATEAKRKQLLNHMMVVEARAAADTVEAAVKYLGKFRRKRPAGGIDAEYYAQIRELLERHDLRPVSGPQIEKRESLLAFVTAQQALGNPISVPDDLLDEAKRQHIKQMTLGEVEGLRDTVKQIAHLGKLKKTLQTNKEKREFEAGRNSVVLRIETRPEARLPSPNRNPQGWERFTSWARGMDAALLKMEQVIEWLDGGPTGPLHDLVWDRLAGAQGREMDLQVKIAGDLEMAFKRLPRAQRRRFKDKVLVPELGGKTYRRDELLAVALNTGNEGNLSKMLEGEAKRGGAWDRDAVFAALGRLLSKEEWALVQEIWDTIEQLWPETAALEKRLTGVEPVKVERQPVTTPYGVLPGGYYPVVYDPRLDPGAERHQEAAATALFENFITKPTTASGHTKERTGVVKPVLLDLDVLVRHVNQVIHRITHQEAIMQAHRLLTDAKVRAAIESRESPEVYKQFVPWLQAVANDKVQETGLRSWDQLANGIRANATMMGMGYRISTMIAQVTGFSNTAEVVGFGWMLKGIWMTYGNPLKTAEAYRFVRGKSAEMRHRHNTLERDIRDSLRALSGQHSHLDNVKRFAFYGIAMFDGFVSTAAWMAGYHKQLAADPNDDVAAVAAGDRAVRSSQGAGAVKDLAAIQRQPGLWKLLTMFYSFFSVLYNRLRNLGRATKQAVKTGAVRDFPHLLARGFFLLVVPAVLGDILVGKGPDDDKDEEWASWMAKKVAAYPFMSLPVVRDVIGGKTSGFGYQFTPAARAVETVGKLIDDMVKAFDPDQDVDGKQATKHAIETTGYVFGLPLGQVSTTFGNVWDGLENGDLAFRDLFLSKAK